MASLRFFQTPGDIGLLFVLFLFLGSLFNLGFTMVKDAKAKEHNQNIIPTLRAEAIQIPEIHECEFVEYGVWN